MVLNNRGNVHWLIGQWPLAIADFQASLQIVRQINERRGESMLLGNLGSISLNSGDIDRAFDYIHVGGTFIEYVVTGRTLFGWVVAPNGNIHVATVNHADGDRRAGSGSESSS